MGRVVVNIYSSPSKTYVALLLSILVVSGLSFNGRSFLPSIRQLKHVHEIASLRLSTSDDLNIMTVKDLKDQLRAKGLSVTGLKKELIERLSESKSKIEHDYLASPKSNILKRPLNSLTRRAKIALDENVSVLVDATEDDVRIIKSKTTPSKVKDGNASNTINPAASVGSKKKEANKVTYSDSTSNRITEDSSSTHLPSNKKTIPEKSRAIASKSTAYSIDDDDFLDQIMNDGNSFVDQSPSPSRRSELPYSSLYILILGLICKCVFGQ